MGKRHIIQNENEFTTDKKKAINKKREYNGINNLIKNGRYDLAVVALEEFLEKYPENSYALKEYASIIRQQKKPEEALKEIKKIPQNVRYKIDVNQIMNFCYAKLGQYDEITGDYYSIQQVISYDSEKALAHINSESHMDKSGNEGIFSSSVNVEELYHNIRMILPDSKNTIIDQLMTCYIYYIKDVGYSNTYDTPINHLSVITLPNSYDILTMFPDSTITKRSMINDYERLLHPPEEVGFVKTKRRQSQIDKFNQRYGKK